MKNFGNVPAVRYNRSKFDLSHGVKTSMTVGKQRAENTFSLLYRNKNTNTFYLTSDFLINKGKSQLPQSRLQHTL